jgi:hypothetical protein
MERCECYQSGSLAGNADLGLHSDFMERPGGSTKDLKVHITKNFVFFKYLF